MITTPRQRALAAGPRVIAASGHQATAITASQQRVHVEYQRSRVIFQQRKRVLCDVVAGGVVNMQQAATGRGAWVSSQHRPERSMLLMITPTSVRCSCQNVRHVRTSLPSQTHAGTAAAGPSTCRRRRQQRGGAPLHIHTLSSTYAAAVATSWTRKAFPMRSSAGR